jgi:hypothetical protein
MLSPTVAYLPKPKPAASVPLVHTSGVAAGAGNALAVVSSESVFDAERMLRIIEMVQGANGVRYVHGEYMADEAVLSNLDPTYRPMILAAVARANSDVTTGPAAVMPMARTMSASDIADKVKEVGEQLRIPLGVIVDIQKFVAGIESSRSEWWGLTLELTRESATALERVLGPHLTAILAVLAPVIPNTAVVLAIIAAAGQLLSTWISSSNGSNGVRIQLLLWVVPVISGR